MGHREPRPVAVADELTAALDSARKIIADARAAGAVTWETGEYLENVQAWLGGMAPEEARAGLNAVDSAASLAPRLLAALDAALKFHERVPLYGNAATEDEPDACPHDPDSPLHFEADDGSGEWLCEGRPEGEVCSSCTEDGLPVAWPCPEYAAILAALSGKNAENAG